jgi:predicted molibdopterin-dependent oxidoreductase YjgC
VVLGSDLTAIAAAQPDTAGAEEGGGIELLSRLDTLIVLDTHHSELERVAHVLLPVLHAAEKEGTLTNHAGRVQRVRAAVTPKWPAQSEGALIAQLAGALGLEGFDRTEPYDPHAVSSALSRDVPAFRGVDMDTVGTRGRPLANRMGDL